jgi:hypothetical protein
VLEKQKRAKRYEKGPVVTNRMAGQPVFFMGIRGEPEKSSGK